MCLLFLTTDSLFFILNDLGAKSLQSLWWDLSYSNQRVELFLCIFVIISLASNTNSDSPRDTSDSSAPDVLIQLHVHSDILCAHSFHCKLPDLLDGCGGLLFECAAMQALVEVDGVLPGNHFLFSSFGFVRHFQLLLSLKLHPSRHKPSPEPFSISSRSMDLSILPKPGIV